MSERERLTAGVDCGDGAVMSVPRLASTDESGVQWHLRYGEAERVRFAAAGLVESYDYLLSGEITTAEAIRCLRLLRAARREAVAAVRPTPCGVA